ncbi:class I SAM-dependent methyltransferase [Halorubrum laminariae]|uniref:Class I SAM-dependent methyltransferase n=1 Tax=Halorubrum laminariae TaxID=1433523 RepID=A0ABD6C312_9EURY|nr:methyltransferase domain-containing protein [Halorubrum laminariae]
MINSFAKAVLPESAIEKIIRGLGTKGADRQNIVTSCVDSDDSVLDIGCVQHSLDNVNWRNPRRGEWLHADLRRVTDDVIGIDIVEDEIERMSEAGFDVEVGNAETFNFDRKFDVVVAGELIEHLSNPGQFLDRCREHVHDDGQVIISTPNPRRLEMVLWFLFGTEHQANPEHTMWFDHYVMDSLVSRHGFVLDDFEFHKPSIHPILRPLYRLGIGRPLSSGGYIFKLTPV